MSASVNAIVDAYAEQLLAEASTPPSSWYIDSRVFDLERRTVFSRSWQVAGRLNQVTQPGQFLTCEIAGEPVVVVRGNDNVLRGFFNVCRHHAAAVMTKSEGALVLTPEFGGIANFDRGANGLVPVQIGVWNRSVFAKLNSGDPSLDNFLGSDLIERCERLNFERMKWFERRVYTLNCNWKVFVDNYLDGGYHVPHIHGGLNSVLDYRNYTIETGERFCLQSSPMATDKGDGKTAPVRTGSRAFYYWIYPNFMVNIYDDVMDTNLVIPRSVDTTEVVFDYYFIDVSEQAKEKNLASIAVSEQIQSEDVAVCESVQRGLASRAYTTGRLSVHREAGEHLFHTLLHGDLKKGLQSLQEVSGQE